MLNLLNLLNVMSNSNNESISLVSINGARCPSGVVVRLDKAHSRVSRLNEGGFVGPDFQASWLLRDIF